MKEKLYEGKAKIIYSYDDKHYIQYFKDDATAFDATKKGTIVNKGIVNNKVSSLLFALIEHEGIPTHFVKLLSEREMLVKKVEIIPLEVTMRNIAAGGISKSLGIKEGTPLDIPVLEFHYKNDSLHDPLINNYHIFALHLASGEEVKIITEYSFRINKILQDFFKKAGITLVDFKLEFGRNEGKIILADEISPDTCRLWDINTGEKLDKDRFRRDLGKIEDAYQEVLKRLNDLESRSN